MAEEIFWKPPTPRSQLTLVTKDGQPLPDHLVLPPPLVSCQVVDSIPMVKHHIRSTSDECSTLVLDDKSTSATDSLPRQQSRDHSRLTPTNALMAAEDVTVPNVARQSIGAPFDTTKADQAWHHQLPHTTDGGSRSLLFLGRESDGKIEDYGDGDFTLSEDEPEARQMTKARSGLQGQSRRPARAKRNVSRPTSPFDRSHATAASSSHPNRRVSHSAAGEEKLARAKERGRKRGRSTCDEFNSGQGTGLHKLEVLQGTIAYIEQLEEQLQASHAAATLSVDSILPAKHTYDNYREEAMRAQHSAEHMTAETLLNLSTSPELRPVSNV
ncbi:hypothetical protein OIO90_004057 [Microbotryomycetes sp. JL221]|nr:hypothetical protein OIO90_004057 [Microbotryomycetes sp. JL221]